MPLRVFNTFVHPPTLLGHWAIGILPASTAAPTKEGSAHLCVHYIPYPTQLDHCFNPSRGVYNLQGYCATYLCKSYEARPTFEHFIQVPLLHKDLRGYLYQTYSNLSVNSNYYRISGNLQILHSGEHAHLSIDEQPRTFVFVSL